MNTGQEKKIQLLLKIQPALYHGGTSLTAWGSWLYTKIGHIWKWSFCSLLGLFPMARLHCLVLYKPQTHTFLAKADDLLVQHILEKWHHLQQVVSRHINRLQTQGHTHHPQSLSLSVHLANTFWQQRYCSLQVPLTAGEQLPNGACQDYLYIANRQWPFIMLTRAWPHRSQF